MLFTQRVSVELVHALEERLGLRMPPLCWQDRGQARAEGGANGQLDWLVATGPD